MRLWVAGAVLLGAATAGCGSVRVVQREGCWVRQSEGFLRASREEVGPCARREPRWSNDRLARLVQECMAEADYRWESQALAAWNRGQPLPAQEPERAVMRACMNDAATAVVAENEALRRRLAEVVAERDALRASAQADLDHMRASEERMTDALGEAAKRPAPSAFATSTSSGTASTDSSQATLPQSSSVTVSTPTIAPQALPAPPESTIRTGPAVPHSYRPGSGPPCSAGAGSGRRPGHGSPAGGMCRAATSRAASDEGPPLRVKQPSP